MRAKALKSKCESCQLMWPEAGAGGGRERFLCIRRPHAFLSPSHEICFVFRPYLTCPVFHFGPQALGFPHTRTKRALLATWFGKCGAEGERAAQVWSSGVGGPEELGVCPQPPSHKSRCRCPRIWRQLKYN